MWCQREYGLVGLVALVAVALLVCPVAAQETTGEPTAAGDVTPAAGDVTPAAGGEPAAEGQQNAQPPGLLGNPMILIIGMLFYFIVLAPQKKERRKKEAMINSMQKHDRVVTAGGIIGSVVSVDEDRDIVVLEVDRDTQMQFLRRSIQGPMGPERDEGDTASSSDKVGD